ncbi:MAG: lipoyl synthase [Solidesulfovibrio sp. DCME]|uniref:lipoyl synthase n=1 Tax=Solidesulfovibrio sp. DCME TaxID=3447380 RepID=UPI003D11494D
MPERATARADDAAEAPSLEVLRPGLVPYDEALALQRRLLAERIADQAPDRLLLLEHPPVITLGTAGGEDDVVADAARLDREGVAVCRTERGGRATFHGPGQLVAYPILKLREKDLHAYLRRMLDVAAAVLAAYGLSAELGLRGPGVWVGGAKVASIGLAVRKWVTFHGLALNVNTDLGWFSRINPCGYAGERMTSLRELLGRELDMDEVAAHYLREFRAAFGYPDPHMRPAARPGWLRVPAPDPAPAGRMEALLADLRLGTVCQEANCPNLGECFNRGTATFLILGTVCTRGCRYCAVEKGLPRPCDPGEPERVARAVAALGLRHAVVTSVTRDDLPDGGAGHFARTIAAIRARCPDTSVEVLVPDFAGSPQALDTVRQARPDVFNHNIETVRRLFPTVRPKADYALSLAILGRAVAAGLAVKSGLMLGLGETDAEIAATLGDLRAAGCRQLTLGQYLAPTPAHAPVDRYVTPAAFAAWADAARAMGFDNVAAGPLVRSSYRAEAMLRPRPTATDRARVA